MQFFLWKLACEDYQILLNSSKKDQRKLLISGVIMVINYLVAFIAMTQLFNIILGEFVISFGLGIFTSLVFMNIYRLCLTTLNKSESGINFSYLISFFGRLLFVGLIGLLIVKCFEIFLIFSISDDFETHKYQGELIASFSDIHNSITAIWILSISLVLFFITPFLIKILIGHNNKYEIEKRAIERNMIVSDYKNFKSIYKEIFLKKFDLNLEFKEHYLDPPFNSVPIEIKESLGNTKDFLNTL